MPCVPIRVSSTSSMKTIICNGKVPVMFKAISNIVARVFSKRSTLHPCHNCLQLMKANGYGLCEECLEAVDEPGNRLQKRWTEARQLADPY